ncbi:MAG: M48 family metalloprotease [Desulfomonilia bacterium]|jgi:predicted Zn-dependent protease
MKRILIALLIFMTAPLGMAHATGYGDEKKTARDFVNLLEANNLIIHDQAITWTVQQITDRLANHIKEPVYTFKVYVVKDRSVNAFSIPDGDIFINLGLLLFIQDLDELSAVIGHEMGHCQLRHYSEDVASSKKITAATILGVLAGTLLSSKNPEAGAAMVLSSVGGSENIRLAYSREHEYAADNFSKEINIASGVDPSGMPRFLIRLRTFYGFSDIPEYLLTHPYTENRIMNMKEDSGKPAPDNNYWMLYASVVGLSLTESEVNTRSNHIPEPYKSLALGLMQTRIGKNSQALKLLQGVDLPLAYEYRGLNLYAIGKNAEAYAFLKDYAKSPIGMVALAEILQGRNQLDEAIKTLLPLQSQSVRVDYTLGTLYEKTNKPALAHVSFARYFYRTENSKACIYHIDEALKAKDLPKDTVDELKMMKDMMKKGPQNME